MYRIIRTIHLYSGLIIGAYIIMYAFTGFVMLHPDWFPGGEEETTRQLVSSIAKNLSAELGQRESRALSYRLARELDLRGRPEDPKRERDATWIFSYRRPGTRETLRVTPGSEKVVLTVQKGGFAPTMRNLHHLHGYEGGLRFFLWGFFLDLVSAAMIFFSLSGIYLWYVLKRERRLGWIVLGSSTAYVVGSIFYLLF